MHISVPQTVILIVFVTVTWQGTLPILAQESVKKKVFYAPFVDGTWSSHSQKFHFIVVDAQQQNKADYLFSTQVLALKRSFFSR